MNGTPWPVITRYLSIPGWECTGNLGFWLDSWSLWHIVTYLQGLKIPPEASHFSYILPSKVLQHFISNEWLSLPPCQYLFLLRVNPKYGTMSDFLPWNAEKGQQKMWRPMSFTTNIFPSDIGIIQDRLWNTSEAMDGTIWPVISSPLPGWECTRNLKF